MEEQFGVEGFGVEETSAAKRRRSLSEAADVGAAGGASPRPGQDGSEESGGGQGALQQVSPELDGDGDGPAPQEECLHLPRLVGGRPGRTLVRPGQERAVPRAVDSRGRSLVGCLILVEAEEDEATTEAPFTLACEAGDGMVLAAPASLIVEGNVLSFAYWQVDGKPLAAGQPAVRITADGPREAVAFYSD